MTPGIVNSDEFNRKENEPALLLVWQWNHNPIDKYWSVSNREGFLRLTTDRIDSSVVATRNTLTQRTIGPVSVGSIAMDVSGMKEGDVAGLVLLQEFYGYVGVHYRNGEKYIVQENYNAATPVLLEEIPMEISKKIFKKPLKTKVFGAIQNVN